MSGFLSLEASGLLFAASAACRSLIKTARRRSPSTLIGEDEAGRDLLDTGMLGNCWLLVECSCNVSGQSSEEPTPNYLQSHAKEESTKKGCDTDFSTDSKTY